jgi:hypothetical protein
LAKLLHIPKQAKIGDKKAGLSLYVPHISMVSNVIQPLLSIIEGGNITLLLQVLLGYMYDPKKTNNYTHILYSICVL